MIDYGVKVIVKVGKRPSNIRFSKAKVYRSITVENLDYTMEKHRDCNVLVIESIYEDEQDDIIKSIEKFKTLNNNNIVLFYIEGRDDITSGIADELNYDIYMEIDGLYKAIQRHTEVSVSTRLEDKRKYSNDILEELGVSFENIENTDDLIEEVEEINQEASEIIQKEREEIEDIQRTEDAPIDDLDINEDLGEIDNEEYKQLIKDVRDANARVLYLERIVKVVREEKAKIETRFKSIVNDESVMEDPISLQEYKGIQDELTENRRNLQKLQEELDIYKEELEKYKKSLKASEIKLDEHIEELRIIREEKERLESSLREQIEELTTDIEAKTKDIEGLTSKLEETGEDRNRLLILSDSTKEKLDIKELELQEKEEDILQLKNRIEELKNIISDKDKEVESIKEEKDNTEESLRESLSTKERENNELELKLENVKSQLETKIEELNNKTEQYNDLVALAGDGGENIEAIANANTVLKETISKLNNDIKEIRKERDDITNKYSASDQKIKSLELQNERLKDSLSVISQSGGGGLIELPPMDYSSRAKIISIYGNGSFGITTTAMTIANKLMVNSKTLYIDFDLSSPDADAWFKKSPLNRNVMGFTKGDYSYTGLGIIINQGLDVFINNIVNIITPIRTSRVGRLDYISGLYDEVNPSKIAGVDFNGLFNYLGNNYDYIILDLGKLGGSNTADQLIKMFTNISYSSVLVTINDYFKIRNSAMRLQALSIDFNRVNWILNLGEDTIISDLSRKAMSPSKFTIIPYDKEIYGKRDYITRGKISRDKFNLFMKNNINI